MRLTIAWLYAGKMNIYGDRGNVLDLHWDAGAPWELRLTVAAPDPQSPYRLGGYLVRGEERMPLDEPILFMRGGLLIARGAAGFWTDHGAFDLVPALRTYLNLEVPRAEVLDLVSELHALPHLPPLDLPEQQAQPRQGDILLGLDWVADDVPSNTALLDAWRVQGARILFVVYDLIPVQQPQWFPEGLADMHARWLRCIGTHADGLICISRSVADDVRRWYGTDAPSRKGDLSLGYFYPGNDPGETRPTKGMPDDAGDLVRSWGAVPTFLMVGTVEPRKGHLLVLDAFDQLWADGVEANLVVVGREGWMSGTIAGRLRSHALAGTRLFWLERASDEYLELLYGGVRALIAASAAEGFGLPLVEAARHGLPVIARDIPVFREVSSDFATYFDGGDMASLVAALRAAATSPRPDVATKTASVLTWKDTSKRLYEMLDNPDHAQWLQPWRPGRDDSE